MFICSLSLEAKDYRFVYIAHDQSTPTNKLVNRLKEYYENAIEYQDVLIIYLSNANQPIIVRVNTEVDANPDDFENILMGELQNYISHEVLAGQDAHKIVEVISQNDFIDINNTKKYNDVNFEFFVGSEFWQLGYNESLLAAVYWGLELNKLNDITLNVYHDKNDVQDVYSSKTPFGIKNLNDINNKLLVLSY